MCVFISPIRLQRQWRYCRIGCLIKEAKGNRCGYPLSWFYTHSSDFLISCIFSIVVLPTLRYFISSPSGIVRNRLTSIISCPFSQRMMFASLSALFAIVKTLSSFIIGIVGCPLAASGVALSFHCIIHDVQLLKKHFFCFFAHLRSHVVTASTDYFNE